MQSTHAEFEAIKERHLALQAEIQSSVPFDEYERLKATLAHMDDQVSQMSAQIAKAEREALGRQ